MNTEKTMERPKVSKEEQEILNRMFAEYQKLKALGWKEAIYCPKDGSMLHLIEAGSTGVHLGNYQGKWPNGSWWVFDGDTWPSRPILFKSAVGYTATKEESE